jgi:dsRNA-specific ribonuclease
MAKEEYPLQALRELRERAKDDAMEALAGAIAEEEAAKQRVTDAVRELAEARELRARKAREFDADVAAGRAGIAQMRTFDHYRLRLLDEEASMGARIEELRAAAREAGEVSAARRAELEDAATQLEAVVKHRGGWDAERAMIRQRKDEAAMDEVATRIWREQNQ